MGFIGLAQIRLGIDDHESHQPHEPSYPLFIYHLPRRLSNSFIIR